MKENTPQTNNIAGILLAAGSASRFGSDKRLLNINDQTMIVTAAKKLKNELHNTHVVIATHDHKLKEILNTENINTILCNDTEKGIGNSISCAIRNIPDASAWVLALADMPFIASTTYTTLLQKLRHGASICAPSYQGQRGHPVGFQKKYQQQLISLHNDEGARHIIKNHATELTTIEVDDPGILIDIDTRQDWEKLKFNQAV